MPKQLPSPAPGELRPKSDRPANERAFLMPRTDLHHHHFDAATGICSCIPGVAEQTTEREYRRELPQSPGKPASERLWAAFFDHLRGPKT